MFGRRRRRRRRGDGRGGGGGGGGGGGQRLEVVDVLVDGVLVADAGFDVALGFQRAAVALLHARHLRPHLFQERRRLLPAQLCQAAGQTFRFNFPYVQSELLYWLSKLPNAS